MAVTYHDLRTAAAFLPSAEAKLSDWSSVEAQWLGDDLDLELSEVREEMDARYGPARHRWVIARKPEDRG